MRSNIFHLAAPVPASLLSCLALIFAIYRLLCAPHFAVIFSPSLFADYSSCKVIGDSFTVALMFNPYYKYRTKSIYRPYYKSKLVLKSNLSAIMPVNCKFICAHIFLFYT